MKKLCLVAAFCLLGAASMGLASDSGRNAGVPRPGVGSPVPVTVGRVVERPGDFGPNGDAVSTFHRSAFQPVDSTFTFATNGDEIWPTSYSTGGFGTIFQANLQVPEGVMIDFVVFDFCKDNANASGIVVGAGDNNGDFADVGVPATSGCFQVVSPALGRQTTQNAGHIYELFVNWFSDPIDGSIRLSGGEVWWHRTVSTGPVVADFGDVPTSDPRYNFIEAIYQAGITAGCGAGNYCPDAPLTRGQMAVFIAKALGLYWPNP